MRKEIRYRLEAPAIFTWENFQHQRLYGEGVTRDISLLGAFIVSATCPPSLAAVRVEVALPSVVGIEADIRIIGEAHVVRVERSNSGQSENGFALVPSDLNNWSLLTLPNEPDVHRERSANAARHVA